MYKFIKILKQMTRKLSKDEINYILDFIKPSIYIPSDSANMIIKNIKDKLECQLLKQQIYPEIIDKLKENIIKEYNNSLINAGESVGIICAQSIGEKQTQTTLNTFHKAGQSETTMTQGVPRFQELINTTKKPRIVNNKIYFKNHNKTIEETRELVNNNIVGLSLVDISLSINISINKSQESWYEPYKILYNDNFKNHPNCITIKLNMKKIFEYKINIKNIVDNIHKEYEDLFCVFSPENIGQLDIFVDTTSIELPDNRILFIDKTNAIEIYIEECVQPIIENFNICGINGIKECFYIKEGNEWIIETNGINSRTINNQYINYKKLLALDIVDFKRTISNNVWDIYEVLGIEAARAFLIEEFMSIMEGINIVHTLLLVDRMTFGGTIASITRYTMKRDESGPFGKASFEETQENFLNAGARGEIEPTEGVSSSIICGKRANIGTGMFDLKIDIKKLPNVSEY